MRAATKPLNPKLVITDDLPAGYQDVLAIFGRALDDERASAHTHRLYLAAAERFLGFMAFDLGTPLPIDVITKEHAREWLRSIKGKSATVRSLYQGTRRFYSVMLAEGEAKANPFDGLVLPKAEMKDVAIVTADDMRALLRVAERVGGVWAKRDVAILFTLFDGGLRASELLNVKAEDIDWRDGAVFVTGKGNRPRRVGLGNKALRALRSYLNVKAEWERKRPQYLRLSPEAPIWLSHKGAGERTLSYAALRGLIENLRTQAKIEKPITPHSFRHTSATHKAGRMQESELRAAFGWTANSAQVHRYTRSNLEQRAIESSRKASPGDAL